MQVVPILRAGLVPLEQANTVLPAMETYHVGLVRDEQTLQVSAVAANIFLALSSHAECWQKLPNMCRPQNMWQLSHCIF